MKLYLGERVAAQGGLHALVFRETSRPGSGDVMSAGGCDEARRGLPAGPAVPREAGPSGYWVGPFSRLGAAFGTRLRFTCIASESR